MIDCTMYEGKIVSSLRITSSYFLTDDQEYVRRNVPMPVIADFLQTLLYFLDFLQKERFNKLKKLRSSQANLPIAQFR